MRSVWEDRRQTLEDMLKKGYSIGQIARFFGSNWTRTKEAILRFQIPHTRYSQAGPNNPAWKGGEILEKGQYILVHSPDHPNANGHGYMRKHRLVMEAHIGRYLDPREVVHHKDGNTLNNAIENLELFESNGAHLAETLLGKVPKWSDAGKRHLQRLSSHRNEAGRLLPIRDLLKAEGDPALTRSNPSRKREYGKRRRIPSETVDRPKPGREGFEPNIAGHSPTEKQ